MGTPYSKTNVHENSIASFNELDLAERQQAIFKIYAMYGKGYTDRDILRIFTHGRGGDLNKVQPRITELVNDPKVPLTEIGQTISKVTGRRVRVVMYAPELCGIPRTNFITVYTITGGGLNLPYYTTNEKAARVARSKGFDVLFSTMLEKEYQAIPATPESAVMLERLGG